MSTNICWSQPWGTIHRFIWHHVQPAVCLFAVFMWLYLEKFNLLKDGQVDVHGDGGSHHQRHLVQQLWLIWKEEDDTERVWSEAQLAVAGVWSHGRGSRTMFGFMVNYSSAVTVFPRMRQLWPFETLWHFLQCTNPACPERPRCTWTRCGLCSAPTMGCCCSPCSPWCCPWRLGSMSVRLWLHLWRLSSEVRRRETTNIWKEEDLCGTGWMNDFNILRVKTPQGTMKEKQRMVRC